jgi:hypothetical protein
MSEKLASKYCCEVFAKARERGTDAEGYGEEITVTEPGYPPEEYPAHYEIGHDLPPIRFCPWCGTKFVIPA